MTGMRLYELAGADPGRLLSPYCWRVRLALAAKGLEAETIVWRLAERGRIAAHGAQKVPVLLHGGRAVVESFAIAEYLEDAFPDRPSLFGGPGGRATARFVNGWAEATLMAGLARLIIADIPKVLTPEDAAYFRATREARFGRTLEAVQEGREERVAAFREAIHPLRMTLRAQPFLGGGAPLQADAIAFGPFQWARVTSPFRVLAPDDPVEAWRQRMLGLHDGLARRVTAFYD